MFKEIVNISKNYAMVRIEGTSNDDLLNLNLVFEDQSKKILGEVEEIIDGQVKVSFLGEFIEGKFYSGIIRKPSLTSKVRMINNEELAELVGANDGKSMILGLSPLYNDCQIKINIDDMWSNHNAFFGNTGSGKTYGMSRFVQNLFNMPDNKILTVSERNYFVPGDKVEIFMPSGKVINYTIDKLKTQQIYVNI